MGKIRFRIHPHVGSVNVRDENKIKKLMYIKSEESEASWSQRMTACLDPIFNRQFGCFSKDNTKKISCLSNVLPEALSCVYFGGTGTKYCIPESSSLACKGECDFSQTEVERLYGCSNSGGLPPSDCNSLKEDFCDCSVAGKSWNPNINACQCNEGDNDYGACCSETVCRAEYNEQFDCESNKCECEENYHRLPTIPSTHPLSSYSTQCAKMCGIGSEQNNPINYESKTQQSGCGAAIGENGDMCCSSNQCILDSGSWDSQYTLNPHTKSLCLSTYGVWKISNQNLCPRPGHCEYPLCQNPVQILDQFHADGPAWALTCESCTAPETTSPPQCLNACKNFCESNSQFPVYEKSHCGTSGTSQDTCICHCTS